MNKGIIFCLGTTIGAIAGVVGTYFYMNKKINETISKEVAEFKKEWAERSENNGNINNNENYIQEEAESNVVECPSEAISGPSEALNDSEPKENRPDYYKGLIEGLNYGKFDYTKPGSNSNAEEKTFPDPYILDDSELWDEPNGYEKIELIYYSHDQVFTDYQDREYDFEIGAQNMVGINNIDYLEDPDNKVEIIYVMNERFNTIYEISIERKSYTDDVLPTLGEE